LRKLAGYSEAGVEATTNNSAVAATVISAWVSLLNRAFGGYFVRTQRILAQSRCADTALAAWRQRLDVG
jgi:hypothetical protein